MRVPAEIRIDVDLSVLSRPRWCNCDVLFCSGNLASGDQERDLRAVSKDLVYGRWMFMGHSQEGDAVNG